MGAALDRFVEYQNLRDRTFKFALATIEFCRELPSRREARRIAAQLFDCATSVGANYRAAGRARSDGIHREGTVVDEADESVYWLDLLKHSMIHEGPSRDARAREAAELRAIFATSRKTAIRNREAKRRNRSAAR
jgi:four helix bundle protein